MKKNQYLEATKTLTQFIDWSKDIRCDFANELKSKGKYNVSWIDMISDNDISLYKHIKRQRELMMEYLSQLGTEFESNSTYKWQEKTKHFRSQWDNDQN